MSKSITVNVSTYSNGEYSIGVFEQESFIGEFHPNESATGLEATLNHLVAEFGESVPAGVGSLGITFNGTLNDKMKGFYRSTYEHNGEKKNMAVTQFEPADARKCFPCWDEPACKGLFAG